jgi:hypothetical protein
MKWTRSEALALAAPNCAICRGLGLRKGREEAPCNCTFRAIFRACYARFRHCSTSERHISRISLEANPGGHRKAVWSRKNEEYIADFCLVSRRVLNDFEYRLFKAHFLLGADWRLCCRKMGMDRGNFFHEVYRIQQRLGRVYRELQPYGLYPLDEYFGGTTRELGPRPHVAAARVIPIRPPMALPEPAPGLLQSA